MTYDIEKLGKIPPARQDIYLERDGFSLPMNIYLPESFGAENNKRTAVIAIHGGAWYTLLKRNKQWQGGWMSHTCRFLASCGFVALEICYRSRSTAPIADTVYDVAAAVFYAEENLAKEFNFDKIVVTGDSAGGHLALAAAFLSTHSKMLAGVAACNPVCDFLTSPWGKLLPNDEDRRRASPLYLASRVDFPITLIHGDRDKTVDYNESVDFINKMKALGNNANLVTLKGAEHAFILYGYTTPKEKVDEYNTQLSEIIAEMGKQCGMRSAECEIEDKSGK